MYYLTEFKPETYDLFSVFLPKNIQAYLDVEKNRTDLKIIVLGAAIFSELIGAIIAITDNQDSSAYKIVYFFVKKRYEHFEIKAELLHALEEKIKKHNGKKIKLYFQLLHGKEQKKLESIQSFLHKSKWPESVLKFTEFIIKDNKIYNEKWFKLEITPGYKLIPFSKLTLKEKQNLKIENQNIQSQNFSILDPFRIQDFEPKTSLVVKDFQNNKIIGWMINEIRNNYLIYSQLFINPLYRNKGLFFPLLSNSIYLGLKHYVLPKKKIGKFIINAEDQKIKSVYLKLMGRLCDYIIETHCSEKIL